MCFTCHDGSRILSFLSIFYPVLTLHMVCRSAPNATQLLATHLLAQSACQEPEGRDLSLIKWPGRREKVCSSSFVERRTRDSSPLSSYSFNLLVSTVTINTLQNTRRPSISYLSGYFKAIFQREATSGSKRSPSRRQTRGHTGRPPAICGPIGTAQSKHRAAPLAPLHSFTPLSSCAIVARPFADTPGEIDPPRPRQRLQNYHCKRRHSYLWPSS